MKPTKKITLLLGVLMSQLAFAAESPRELFARYIQLSDSFDVALAQLYADDAKILIHRTYPGGLERKMALSGMQWKQLIVHAMPLAKAQNDKSTFSNISVSRYENGYKIQADRYSNRKCYTDTGYYMVVMPDPFGRLRIIEEYSETQPQSDCQ